MITDKLASYGAAKREVMPSVEHRQHKGLVWGFWSQGGSVDAVSFGSGRQCTNRGEPASDASGRVTNLYPVGPRGPEP
jgi:hypothetical protein